MCRRFIYSLLSRVMTVKMAIFTGDIYHILKNLRKDCHIATFFQFHICFKYFVIFQLFSGCRRSWRRWRKRIERKSREVRMVRWSLHAMSAQYLGSHVVSPFDLGRWTRWNCSRSTRDWTLQCCHNHHNFVHVRGVHQWTNQR